MLLHTSIETVVEGWRSLARCTRIRGGDDRGHAEDNCRDGRRSEEVNVKPSTTSRASAPYDYDVSFAREARTIALHHGEKILVEIPRALRRFSQFMLVMAITIPAFLAGLLVVLWHFAR